MPDFGYTKECDAVVGVGGWGACTVRGCSCREEATQESDPMGDYYDQYKTTGTIIKPELLPLQKIGLTQIAHQTEKAVLFSNATKTSHVWIPKYALSKDRDGAYQVPIKHVFDFTIKVCTEGVLTTKDVHTFKGMIKKDIQLYLQDKYQSKNKTIIDVGFSTSRIYMTVKKEVSINLEDYIKQNYKKVYKKLWN
jgi:hypothetical protein